MQNNQKIPEGWSVKKLKDVAQVITGSTPSTADNTNYGNEFLFVSPADIKNDIKCVTNTITRLSYKGFNSCRIIKKGSPLFVCIGSTIGKVAIAGEDLATNQQINSCVVKSGFDSNYLYYKLLSSANKIKLLAGEQAVPIINKSTFEKIYFAFPPLPEQEKIAGVLGTWDEAIEKLSSLIEQKKNLKKGLMQRLLTGKTRLKGFTQPWKEVKLGEILVERNEYTTQNNQVTILTSSRKGIFRQEDYFDKQVASENNIGYKILHKYDFTYRAMTDDDVYCFNQLTNEDMGAVSPAYSVFYCENVPNLLIKEILNSKCFGYQLLKISQGGTRKSLKFSALKTLKIYIPSDINEQQAIADVLSTADEEIDLLNKKLEALKEQKKGLMQELLTGQTRVKVN